MRPGGACRSRPEHGPALEISRFHCQAANHAGDPHLHLAAAKHADVADVATFTVSPAKMVVPGAVPLICTTVGGFTVGAAQVALTVVFAVPFCPLPDTTTLMA